jgi:hypothetical protein
VYREVTIKDGLLKYWEDEKKSAKWYRESLDTDDTTEESFTEFCNRHRIFEIDEVALVYLEYVMPTAVNIHFSLLRGANIDIQDLIEIRNQLFDEGVVWIYGWVAKKNKWLQRVCEAVGMNFYGIEDNTKIVRGKPFTMWRYSMHVTEFLVIENPKSLILSV